eukprot:TRINITY_DN67537_c0_g1_i1.p1 TRINITY_DN67537_c0_g1~~TRINITY_DN67537_c0_g1_i1.p1  ORF type:complete len:517 (-),score=100.87 TRINITY_DN67537_c0_g1_i1:226-1776(-)
MMAGVSSRGSGAPPPRIASGHIARDPAFAPGNPNTALHGIASSNVVFVPATHYIAAPAHRSPSQSESSFAVANASAGSSSPLQPSVLRSRPTSETRPRKSLSLGNLELSNPFISKACMSHATAEDEGAWPERLVNEGYEARLRGLEAAIESTRQRHAEELARVEASVKELRSENSRLRAQLSERDVEAEALRSEAASKTAVTVSANRENSRLRALLDDRGDEVERLGRQLELLLEQLQQCQADSSASRQEKERSLGPLGARVEELSHLLAVKEREVVLTQQELSTAMRRAQESRAEALDQRDRAEQAKQIHRVELAQHEDQVRRMQAELLSSEAELHSQGVAAKERERRLSERCRLLKVWCFRLWWSLDAALDPAFATETREEDFDVSPFASTSPKTDFAPSCGSSRTWTVSRSSSPSPWLSRRGGGGTTEPIGAVAEAHARGRSRLLVSQPPDWRQVLRFQATLFHWLAAETARTQKPFAQRRWTQHEDGRSSDGITRADQAAKFDDVEKHGGNL